MEKIECANCGWTGTTNQLEELDTCPSCFCDGYLCTSDEEYEEEECTHRSTTPSYEYVRCNDCGSILTDSGSSWGIAKNKWFNSESEAKFYKNNGYLPK